MAKTIFEQIGGAYTMQGDYILPDLKLPEKEVREIGVWGQRRKRYLKEHHKVLYYNLLTSGQLNDHLADVDEQANTLLLRLVKKLAQKEGITEKLKAENQMEWVRKMNSIYKCATEIVNDEVVFG